MLLLARTTSSDGSGWYIFGFFAVLFAIFYVMSVRRTKNLTKSAAEFGFLPSEDLPIDESMLVFRESTTLSNRFVGNWNGLEAAFFDLQVGSGKYSYEQTVAGFKRNCNLLIPPFQLHEKGFADKLAMKFSHAYLEIENDPAFTERYSVKTSEAVKDECMAFFDDSVRAYFAQLPPHKFTIEGADDSVIIYKVKKMVKPADVNAFMTEAGNIATGLLSILKEKPPLVESDDEDDEADGTAAGK